MSNVELYHKLKDKLRVLNFGAGYERGFILKNDMMKFNTYRGGYIPNGYRAKNINRKANLLYWSPTCREGHIPTYEEFCKLYDLEAAK